MLSSYNRQRTYESAGHRLPAYVASKQFIPGSETRIYHLVVMMMPAAVSEPERAFLTLQRHQPILDYLAQRIRQTDRPNRTVAELESDAGQLAQRYDLSIDHVRRILPRDVRQPNALLRPFVVRAVCGEQIEIHVVNRTRTAMHLALLDDDYGIQQDEAQRPLASGENGVYFWQCKETGIYPIFNEACPKTLQHRCLLGVLMIEP